MTCHTQICLDDIHHVETMRLPEELAWNTSDFDMFWQKHPDSFNTIHIHGKNRAIPRYQQAYGRNYAFSGSVARACDVPDVLNPMLDWACRTINPGLNGLLVNWYDPALRHYIGSHRDSTRDIKPGTPIVMVSLGGDRLFRLKSYRGKNRRDIEIGNASVVVIPWQTNLAWTHAVPILKRFDERRISITMRCFQDLP